MPPRVRTALRALVTVGVLAACGLARAEDPPATPAAAPAKPSPLTADEQAFFPFWDRFGYPDVVRLPFVHVWTGNRFHYAAEEDETCPEGAFLVSESGTSFTIFHTDLTVSHLETSGPDAKDTKRVGFERADLAAFVRAGLERIAKADPEKPWFDKPDPFDAHRWSIPNQAFRIAVLARACAGRGLDDLAHALCDLARHEQTRPGMTQQWGKDDPDPRASLESVKQSLASEAWEVFDASFDDAALSWSDLLAEAERLTRALAPEQPSNPKGVVAKLRAIVADERERREHPPKPLESLTPEERIDRLVHDLRDVGAYDRGAWKRRAASGEKPAPNAAERLKTLGFAAVPALIDALDDDRPTRSLGGSFSGHAQYRSATWRLDVGDLAWGILEDISGGTLEATRSGGPPTSGQPTARQVAERWYASVRDRGERAVLVEQVRKGGDGSRTAADRLVELDPAAAVDAMETGIRAAQGDRSDRANLLYALLAVKSDAATSALLRLLPDLRASDEGVRLANALFRRGRREGLEELIRQWKVTSTSTGSETSRYMMGTGSATDLIKALAASSDLEAVRALADGLERRSVSERVAVVDAFLWGGGPDFTETLETTEPVDRAIEALVAGRLEDTERDKSLHMGDQAAGDQPIVGEIAAWTLAHRYPERYAFDSNASPRERVRQRLAAANVWRKAHGEAPRAPPAERPAPTPLPLDAVRADVDAAAAGTDPTKRATAIAALEAKGLPAVPALRQAIGTVAKDAPGRADLEALVRRLAFVVAEVVVADGSLPPTDEFRRALDATKGRQLSGAMWYGLWADFVLSATAGTTRFVVEVRRDGAERGVSLTVTCSRAPAGREEGANFDHPATRRGSKSRNGGVGWLPLSVITAPDTFARNAGEFDRQLAETEPDEVFEAEGSVTVTR